MHSFCFSNNFRKQLIIACLLIMFMAFGASGCTEENKPYLGNVLIIGDSYSTFEGYIPEGYDSWYSESAGYTDVNSVEQTWWYQLVTITDSNLLLNCSFSGSTICNTGYDGEDYSKISFVGRLKLLLDQNFFTENQVNTAIVYGGLNDYWAAAPVGEIQFSDFTEEDLYCLFPAVSYLLHSVKENSPETNLIFVIEEQLGEEIKNGIREICQHYNVLIVEPDGIDFYNSHPTARGMKQLTQTILQCVMEYDFR